MKPAEPLHPHDWNFDSVPDSELVACCWWEYSRESKSLCDHLQKTRKISTPTQRKRALNFVLRMLRHRTLLSECITNYNPDSLKDGDPRTKSFPDPWQSLSGPERAKRSHPTLLEHVRKPMGPAGPIDTISLGEKAAELRKKSLPKQLRALDAELPVPESPDASIIYIGMEVVAFEILWEHFNNAKIKKAFSDWVDSNRPQALPGPANDGSGHKLVDWRKKLRDLGVMRLMNFCTVAGMPLPAPRGCPEAARCYARWKDSQWSAARSRALKNFREILPFLPKGEKPTHAKTRGGRAKL
ncbi:MAG: hypothetical protein ACLPT4_12215 [Verrucomicrobiia bacterium]